MMDPEVTQSNNVPTPAPVPAAQQEKPKHKLLPILVTVLVMILIGAASIATWYFMSSRASSGTTDDNVAQKDQKNNTQSVAAEQAPLSFKTISLNGTSVSYPADWGTPTKQKTVEKITDNLMTTNFEGENAYFQGGDVSYASLIVNNAASYRKSDSSAKMMKALEKTYKERAVDLESLYTSNGSIPPVNAGAAFYAVRYVESKDSKWRGYWYVGTISQEISADPTYYSAMYNQDSDKVVTIMHRFQTTMSRGFTKKITSSYSGSETQQQLVINDIELYIRGMYAVDSEIKQRVDDEDVVINKFIFSVK